VHSDSAIARHLQALGASVKRRDQKEMTAVTEAACKLGVRHSVLSTFW
jgi:hypothetical protein